LLGCAVALRTMGYRVRWAWQAAFWGCLVGYLMLRRALIPSDPSGYQIQAFRTGPGVWLDILVYALPAAALVPTFMASFVGWTTVLFSNFWLSLVAACANVAALWQAKRHWQLVAAGYALSVLAFLPMAWLSRFDHYHYLPLAFRSLLVVAMGWVAWDLLVIAVSPRVQQAPLRPSPAPGSLPRP
jgi:hypothetical protein